MANAAEQEMKDVRNDLHQLREDLDAIRHDLARLSQASVDVGKEKVHRARERAEEKLEDAYARVRHEGERAFDTVQQTVEERPITSLLTAFGVGMLMGKLMSEK